MMPRKESVAVLQAYRSVFSGPDGEIVLRDLQNAHHFRSSTMGEGADALLLAMREGERNVVLRIMAILEAKESDYGQPT